MAKAKTMIGYKGFDENFQCRGKQYAVGKTYTHKGDIKLCNSGLHFCENPLDTLDYYNLTDGNFAVVEASGVSDETEQDSKRVAKKLKITAKLDLSALVKASFDFVWSACKLESGKDTSATVSDGHSSKLAASGHSSKLAASGHYSQLAASGDYSQLAASGDYSQLAASGHYSQLAASGEDSVVAGIGYDSTAKATKGSWIVLAEWVDSKPVCVKSVQVDGKKVKADTWYRLTGGELVEAK